MLYYTTTASTTLTLLSFADKAKPISLPGDRSDMARILTCFTLLLIGTDACTPHITNSLWGQWQWSTRCPWWPTRRSLLNPTSCPNPLQYCDQYNLYLDDGPRHPYSCQRLTHFSTTNTNLQTTIPSNARQNCLRPPTNFIRGVSTAMLTNNLRAHIHPDNSSFEEKAIQWYKDLLLNQNEELDDMIGFNNGILIE